MAWWLERGRWKLVPSVLAALWTASFLVAPERVLDSWMHGPSLVVHEAGHIVFAPFGAFLATLGGTLLQLALPAIFAVYFALTRQPFSAALLLYWLGFNLVDVAVYAADARERQLPLITLDPGTHDWWNLLRGLGLLEQDDLIAGLFTAQAWLLLAAGLGWTVWLAVGRRGVRDRGGEPGSTGESP